MNKDKYIKALNEIKASEELKDKVTKVQKVKRVKVNKLYQLSTVAATFALVFTVIVASQMPEINNQTQTPDYLKELKINLPTVNSFENLKNILEAQDTTEATKEIVLPGVVKEQNVSDSAFDTNRLEKEYLNTNVQVDGVDEADIVKTDGEYIYYITQSKLVIIDARDSKNLKIISEIKNTNKIYPREIYINKDKLILIANENNGRTNNSYIAIDSVYPISQNTNILVYDIKNKQKPKVEREIEVEGSYLSSRMIGENIYLVSNKYIYDSQVKEDKILPMYKDTAQSKEKIQIPYNDIYYIPESKNNSYLFIAGFNVNNNRPVNVETMLGAGDKIYASQDNLYIVLNKYDNNGTTEIYKFKLDGGKIEYKAKGEVNGTTLSQFSIDENNGNLRIATSSGNWRDAEKRKNNVYILDENLKQIGALEDLAKGELIYSVRFMGEKAYMVTFKQVDPLFVLDLSNPTAPKVLGELKIPGYSEYLHPYDENHIIGFGQDTKSNGRGGVKIAGVKISIFDVTDVANPKEIANTKLGENTYSELSNNHKALLFSKEKNIFAFPVIQSEKNKTEYSYMVYGIDLQKGFTLRGKITHENMEENYYLNKIDRGLYIENNLFTLSPILVKVTDLNTMNEISSIKISIFD